MFELIVFFTVSTFWRTASTLVRLLNCSTASCARAANAQVSRAASFRTVRCARSTRPQHGAGARQRVGGQRVELRRVSVRQRAKHAESVCRSTCWARVSTQLATPQQPMRACISHITADQAAVAGAVIAQHKNVAVAACSGGVKRRPVRISASKRLSRHAKPRRTVFSGWVRSGGGHRPRSWPERARKARRCEALVRNSAAIARAFAVVTPHRDMEGPHAPAVAALPWRSLAPPRRQAKKRLAALRRGPPTRTRSCRLPCPPWRRVTPSRSASRPRCALREARALAVALPRCAHLLTWHGGSARPLVRALPPPWHAGVRCCCASRWWRALECAPPLPRRRLPRLTRLRTRRLRPSSPSCA